MRPRVILTLLSIHVTATADLSAPLQLQRLHDEGLMHLRKRAAQPARALLSQLEAEAPDHGFTRLLRGHCAWLLDGDVDRAEQLYEAACESFDDGDNDGVAEALHAVGRLCRQHQRWHEADEHYQRAASLRPSHSGLAEEALFVHGKRLLITEGGLADAAAAFERGAATASEAWRPHFTLEAAHARGLLGDAAAAAEHYESARSLGVLRGSATASGDLLATLAVHHEREHGSLETAAAFVRTARHAFGTAAAEAESSRRRPRRRRRGGGMPT